MIALAAPAIAATPDSALTCAPRLGKTTPLVASAETAKDLFIAIERDFFPQANKTEYPDVEAIDSGAYWDVFRRRSPDRDPQPEGYITIRAGGGQLSMRIDKCTSAISHMQLSR